MTTNAPEVSVQQFCITSLLQMLFPYLLFICSGVLFWYISVVPVLNEYKIDYESQQEFLIELREVVRTNSEMMAILIKLEVEKRQP